MKGLKNKNRKFLLILLVIIFILIFLLLFLRKDEDSWIKDKRGVWIQHGKPSSTPLYVESQQQIILCALNLYNKSKNEGITFFSQCLGDCYNYVVDILHNPRIEEDNLKDNQCLDYLSGKLIHFIEMDGSGKIIRII